MNPPNKLNFYIGFDPRERLAYDVARRSILKRASIHTNAIPLELEHLKHVLTRPIERRDGRMWCPISQAPMATEFAISRFAVPLIQQKGWAVFADCDILCTADIRELLDLADERYAVMVVKHEHKTVNQVKMDNQVQINYSRKNWSSVVLWNCSHSSNRKLTQEVLNTWPGRDLHAFRWLDDGEIGELPRKWNHLVGFYPEQNPEPGILHYTEGGPWFQDWKGGELDDLWLQEAESLGFKIDRQPAQ